MLSIQEKIEANAAAKLPLPAGRMPAQELARYKTFLKVESHRLKLVHRGGGDDREVCQARAVILDVLLKYLWNAAKDTLSEKAKKEFPSLALIACRCSRSLRNRRCCERNGPLSNRDPRADTKCRR